MLDFGLAMLSGTKAAGPDGATATRDAAPDEPGHGAGDRGLHVAGAGARASRWTSGRICSRSAWCCTRWRPGRCRSAATRRRRSSTRFFNKTPTSPVAAEPGAAGRAGTDHQQVPGEGSGPALPVGAGPDGRPEAAAARHDLRTSRRPSPRTSGMPGARRSQSSSLGRRWRRGAVRRRAGWWALKGRAPQTPAGPITITPFTTDGGGKYSPRLSPDGERVAYAWAGPNDDNWDIYVKAVGPGTKPLRITEDPAPDASPTWSPDGRQIAFVRVSADDTAAIYTIPSLGGQERKLVDVAGPASATVYLLVPVLVAGRRTASGSPSSRSRPRTRPRASSGSRSRRSRSGRSRLLRRDSLGDLEPQVSPDGRLLAFVRSGTRVFGQPGRVGPARERRRGPAADLRSVPHGHGASTGHRTDPRSSSRTAARTALEDRARPAGRRSAPAGGGRWRERVAMHPSAGTGWCTSRARRRSETSGDSRAPEASRPTETPEKFLVAGAERGVLSRTAGRSPSSRAGAALRTSGSAMPTAPVPSSSRPRRASRARPDGLPTGAGWSSTRSRRGTGTSTSSAPTEGHPGG